MVDADDATGLPAGHTLGELSALHHPTFYTEADLVTTRAKIEAYLAGQAYVLAPGVEIPPGRDLSTATAHDLLATVISLILADTRRGPAGYYLTDVAAVERDISALDVSPAAAEVHTQVRLLLEATHVNNGDNDSGYLVTNTEHLLRDLELLHTG